MRRKIAGFLGILLFAGILLLSIVAPASAQNPPNTGECAGAVISMNPIPRQAEGTNVTITTSGNCFDPNDNYIVQGDGLFERDGVTPSDQKTLPFTVPPDASVNTEDLRVFDNSFDNPIIIINNVEITDELRPKFQDGQENQIVRLGANATFVITNILEGRTYEIFLDQAGDDYQFPDFTGNPESNGEQSISLTMRRDGGSHQSHSLCVSPKGDKDLKSCIPITLTEQPTLEQDNQTTCGVEQNGTLSFTATNLKPNQEYYWFYLGQVIPQTEDTLAGRTGPNDDSFEFEVPFPKVETERFCIGLPGDYNDYGINCLNIQVTEEGPNGPVSCEEVNRFSLQPTPTPPKPPCSKPTIIGDEDLFAGCGSIYTGLGVSFSTEPAKFIGNLMSLLLSISGGILLLLIIYSGYEMMTSQGNPEKIQGARERITSAIVGFLFLVFSLVILEVIGVDILRIPGFGESSDTSYQSVENLRARNARDNVTDSPNCGQRGKGRCTNKFDKNNGCASGNKWSPDRRRCIDIRDTRE